MTSFPVSIRGYRFLSSTIPFLLFSSNYSLQLIALSLPLSSFVSLLAIYSIQLNALNLVLSKDIFTKSIEPHASDILYPSVFYKVFETHSFQPIINSFNKLKALIYLVFSSLKIIPIKVRSIDFNSIESIRSKSNQIKSNIVTVLL